MVLVAVTLPDSPLLYPAISAAFARVQPFATIVSTNAVCFVVSFLVIGTLFIRTYHHLIPLLAPLTLSPPNKPYFSAACQSLTLRHYPHLGIILPLLAVDTLNHSITNPLLRLSLTNLDRHCCRSPVDQTTLSLRPAYRPPSTVRKGRSALRPCELQAPLAFQGSLLGLHREGSPLD